MARADYYTPDGRPVRKAFLRYPVDYARISSGFSLARRHPVLNRVRAHKGIDFAAATGTPIKAAGSGRIASRGRNGGYGNAVVIAHSGGITTLYGHMSRFAKGLKVGDRVQQGQVIGYVGMTGLASGPHVHYEYRVNGVHKNPAKVTVPKADPIPASLMADFKAQTAPLLARLDPPCRTARAGSTRGERHRQPRRPLRKRGRSPDSKGRLGKVNVPLVLSGRERRPAAAGRGGVRVADDELRALEVFAVVDLGAGEVLERERVDQQRHALVREFRVAVLDLLVEREAVLEARAAAAGDEHAQLQLRVALLADQLARPCARRRR